MRMQAADSLIFSQRLRWTRERFSELGRLGLFDDLGVELVRGELVVKPAQSPSHANVIEALTERLTPLLVGKARVRIQLPLAIDDETQVLPDVAIVDRRAPRADHPATALLVIEVSDSTSRYDRIVKAPLYARAGVQAYWRVDLGKRLVEVFSGPQGEKWAHHARVSRGALTVPGFPDLTVGVEELLGA